LYNAPVTSVEQLPDDPALLKQVLVSAPAGKWSESAGLKMP
jgi:hypothetical protein